MINQMKKILSIFSLMAVIVSLASCEHKDLCYHHPHTETIIVKFDWQYEPQANPGGMSVFFYPENGGETRRFDLSRDGGIVELVVGNYRAVAYNNDSEAIRYANGSFENHRLFTRESRGIFEPINIEADYTFTDESPALLELNDRRKFIETDSVLYAASTENIEITDNGTYYDHEIITSDMKGPQLKVDNSGDTVVITMTPRDVICTYTYEVRNVKKPKYVTQYSCALAGMVGQYYPGTWIKGEECVTIPFSGGVSVPEQKLEGKFYTFGENPDNTDKHWFVLFLWQTDGKGYLRYCDVSDQVHNAPDPRRVHLIIDQDLSLPEPIENGSGFQPSVDEWEEEHHDILM